MVLIRYFIHTQKTALALNISFCITSEKINTLALFAVEGRLTTFTCDLTSTEMKRSM